MFDLKYFLVECHNFRELFNLDISIEKMDLAFTSIIHLFSITEVKSSEEKRLLDLAFEVTKNDWTFRRSFRNR